MACNHRNTYLCIEDRHTVRAGSILSKDRMTPTSPTCPFCGKPMIELSYRMRVPKKKAKQKEWDKFFDAFPWFFRHYVSRLKNYGKFTAEELLHGKKF